jgi:hypothetical protein
MDEFIKWGAGDSGIYLDTKARTYSTILSDLKDLTFKTLEETEEWLNKYHNIVVPERESWAPDTTKGGEIE